jgi:hypothetical protein
MPHAAILDRPTRPAISRRARPAKGLLYPLDLAYRQAGLPAPDARILSPAEIPPPYRSLLDHQRDMTMTLEEHCGGRVALRVLSIFSRKSWYFRRVLLSHEYSGRPVEMGAIRISLTVFAPRIRQQILSNRVPLGRVLRDGDVDHLSRPRTFLGVTPNSEMMGVFWMREPRLLYGRQTEVLIDGRKIGDIVEILPPA